MSHVSKYLQYAKAEIIQVIKIADFYENYNPTHRIIIGLLLQT